MAGVSVRIDGNEAGLKRSVQDSLAEIQKLKQAKREEAEAARTAAMEKRAAERQAVEELKIAKRVEAEAAEKRKASVISGFAAERAAAEQAAQAQIAAEMGYSKRRIAIAEQTSTRIALTNANMYRNANVANQVQDIAVQAQGGAHIATIIAQQGSQLASAFGPAGAVIGGAVAIGAALVGVGVAANEAFDKVIKGAADSARETHKLVVAGGLPDLISGYEKATAKLTDLNKEQQKLLTFGSHLSGVVGLVAGGDTLAEKQRKLSKEEKGARAELGVLRERAFTISEQEVEIEELKAKGKEKEAAALKSQLEFEQRILQINDHQFDLQMKRELVRAEERKYAAQQEQEMLKEDQENEEMAKRAAEYDRRAEESKREAQGETADAKMARLREEAAEIRRNNTAEDGEDKYAERNAEAAAKEAEAARIAREEEQKKVEAAKQSAHLQQQIARTVMDAAHLNDTNQQRLARLFEEQAQAMRELRALTGPEAEQKTLELAQRKLQIKQTEKAIAEETARAAKEKADQDERAAKETAKQTQDLKKQYAKKFDDAVTNAMKTPAQRAQEHHEEQQRKHIERRLINQEVDRIDRANRKRLGGEGLSEQQKDALRQRIRHNVDAGRDPVVRELQTIRKVMDGLAGKIDAA